MKAKRHELLTKLKAEADGHRQTQDVVVGEHKFKLATISPEASDWMLSRTAAQSTNIAGISLLMSSYRPAASVVAIDDIDVNALIELDPNDATLTVAALEAYKKSKDFRNWLRDQLVDVLQDILTVPQFVLLQNACADMDERARELRKVAGAPDSPLAKTPSNA